MGIAIVKIKIMPESVESDLDQIKSKSKEAAESEGAKNISLNEEPIAFGLKAVILKIDWPEEKELETFVDKIKNLNDVKSAEVIDMRRALG